MKNKLLVIIISVAIIIIGTAIFVKVGTVFLTESILKIFSL